MELWLDPAISFIYISLLFSKLDILIFPACMEAKMPEIVHGGNPSSEAAKMCRIAMWLLIAVALSSVCAFAQGPTVLCTEAASGATAGDSAGGLTDGGCINSIPTSAPTLYVASDGEVSFHPFGLSADVSDAIELNSNWLQGASSSWTQATDTYDWYITGTSACGSENEPSCEPVGNWFFVPGGQWGPESLGEYDILEAGGGVSDRIILDNNGPSGSAEITFKSDPLPEPGTLSLLGWGLASLAALRRKKSS